MNTIYTRRSVRQFTNKPIETEKVTKLLKAAMQAPSAGNQMPWEFIVIDDRNVIDNIKTFSNYAKMLDSASIAIVVLEKTDTILPFYTQQDLGAATQNLLLEAVNLDLGACWLGVERFTERDTFLKERLNIPANVNVFGVVAVGYPEKEDANKFVDRFDESRIHKNKY